MKKFTRRLAITALSMVVAGQTYAQSQSQSGFPSQPVKLVVPYPAGGATDALARMVAQKMQESWGQSVLVENKPGAGGTLGANLVARGSADGHTALFTITALLQQITLMKLPYDPFKDFAPVSRVAISPSVFAIAPTFAANNLADFVKQVKAEPAKHSFGTYGAGTSAHLQGELLNQQAKIDLLHIPYAGAAPLVTAMIGGQLSSAFLDVGSSRQHLSKFKVLGITGTERLAWLPNVPTLKEQGYHSYDPLGWFGVLLPAAAPKAVQDKYSVEIQRILKLPDVREKIEAMGLIPSGESPDSFAKIMKSDAEIYARIIQQANISLK